LAISPTWRFFDRFDEFDLMKVIPALADTAHPPRETRPAQQLRATAAETISEAIGVWIKTMITAADQTLLARLIKSADGLVS